MNNTSVKVGKAGIVTYKSTIFNADNSKTTGSFTTTSGIVTKDSWKKTAGPSKFSESWSETIKGGVATISVKQVFDGNSFSAKFTNGISPKTALKVGKQSFTGTANYDSTTGAMSFNGTSKSPGVSATFSFDPRASGGHTQKVVVTTNGTAGTPLVHVTPLNDALITTKDNRALQQDQPPQ